MNDQREYGTQGNENQGERWANHGHPEKPHRPIALSTLGHDI